MSSAPAQAHSGDAGDARAAAMRALEALHAATGEPPPSDGEPGEVITRGEVILAERERLLDELGAALELDPDALAGVAEAIRLHAGIQQGTAAWLGALTRARHVVGQRVQSVARLRRNTHR